jgi:protein involved in polysaccharide export with SLBB domain
MVGARVRVIGAIVLLLLMSGCDALLRDQQQDAGLAAMGSATPELRLAAGDKVRVIVFGEDRLSGEYVIDNSGGLSLPLAGTIQAAGLTKVELEQSLTKKLRGSYLRDPKVTVDVTSFRPFYVLGEVSHPGEFSYRSGLNVLSAIAIAGGATYRASTSKVLIQRSGTTEMTEYPQATTVLIMPGDVVRVPERFF